MNSSPMGKSPPIPSHEAMEQAAAWFSLLQSGTATDALQVAKRRLARRRIILGAAITAGASGILSWAVWQRPDTMDTLMAWGADYRTATGERREIRLADGTQVWLSSASAFNKEYDTHLRRLRLYTGEILIQTAADNQHNAGTRPFVVDTAHGRLHALGTRFNVRLDNEDSTQLAVYEGAVRITPTAGIPGTTVTAGRQARFTAEHLEAPAPADPAREVWSRGILLAQDIPLGEVIAELSRYRHGHIAVAPDVARLPVLGSYPLDDVDGALAMLQQALPIQIRHPLPWWTSIEARNR